jgi:hypothetical protein
MLPAGVAWGLVGGVVGGAVAGALLYWAAPSNLYLPATVMLPLRQRARMALPENLRIAFGVGGALSVVSIAAAAIAGEFSLALMGVVAGVGLVTGLILLLWGVLFDLSLEDSYVVGAVIPTRFAGRGPGAVLTASRNNGLARIVGGALTAGLITGALLWFVVQFFVRDDVALACGIATMAFTGVVVGLDSGLHAWLYHYWLRWRRGRDEVLPKHIPQFLAWCGAVERGWLRTTDAYEFRHRELLDHLAASDVPEPRPASASAEPAIGAP